LAGVTDAVLAVDLEGRVQFLNAPAESMLGCERPAALGRVVDSLLPLSHERTGQPLINPVREALRLGAPVSIVPQCCLRGAGGQQFLIEGMVQPVNGSPAGLNGAVLVFRDLGPRRRLEAGMKQAQKSELVGQLRNGISHDLNNLLTIVIGFSDVLLSKIRGSKAIEGQEEALTEIKSAAQKAALLTQQILALGRDRHVQPTLVDLNDLLRSMEKTLGRIMGANIRISLQLADDVPLIFIDPLQMMQMIFHVCLNAREAIPQTGEIVFATRKAPDVGPATGSPARDRAELIVTDNGVGMDAETLARAREPFYTTKSENKGMGLAVVEELLHGAGGDLRLESEPGRGCRVIFSIPASDTQPGLPTAPTKSSLAPVPSAGGAILLVEDADRVRRLLTRVLQDAGYKVFHAANGRAGLELCHKHDGKIQLLITDVIMPEMNGPELVKSLKSMKQQPRVLFLSGYTGDELERQGLDPNRYHFLQKPFLGEALLRKVREVLGGPQAR
jgi:signal transduction histidine kinase/CheY-like chemotaxis protein